MPKSEEYWNKEKVYDEQISPLMRQIIQICKDNQLPMVAKFQYANEAERGPGYCTTRLAFDNASEKMHDLSESMKNEAPFLLAEMTVTNPDGSQVTSIQRVRIS